MVHLISLEILARNTFLNIFDFIKVAKIYVYKYYNGNEYERLTIEFQKRKTIIIIKLNKR